MPESTIEVARTLQYSSRLYSLSQQMKSKFASRVRRETIIGAKSKSFDRLGEADSQENTTRHGETPLNEQEHSRRWVTMTDIDSGTLLDKEDEWKILIEPGNKYAAHQAAKLARDTDDKIIAGALGSALAGEEADTSIAFKDDSISINGDGTVTSLGTLAAVKTVDIISLAKMLLMMQIFNQEDVDPDIMKYWAVTPKTISDMLDLTEVGSADYNTVKTLTTGKVESFMGFKWFWSNRITKDAAAGTAYRSIAWAEDGIILGEAKGITTKMSERNDLKHSKQVYSFMSNGAVRFEGAKVHECLNKVA